MAKKTTVQIKVENEEEEKQSLVQRRVEERKGDQECQFVVPKSSKQLKACLKCGLMKTHDEWVVDRSCQNCGPFRQLTLSNNVTAQHQG